jgi:ATP-dependent Lon protease
MHDDFRKLELKNQIHQKTSKDLDKQQREYFLNQQIRTIQEELGGGTETDIEELKKKAEKSLGTQKLKNISKRTEKTSTP